MIGGCSRACAIAWSSSGTAIASSGAPGPDGTELVNPGSVGMPIDGDNRAAWASWDGDFTLHRVAYDVERAVAAARSIPGEFGELMAHRYLYASD